jgi:hypothetical protein
MTNVEEVRIPAYVGEELTDPENPDAPRGITAYLVHVARNHPQTMCAMLARMMPIQSETTQSVNVTIPRLP